MFLVIHNFFPTQFLLLNLHGWFFVSSSKFIIFWYSIIIYYYYITLISSIVFCLCSGPIYLSLCFSLSCSIFFSELFCGEAFQTLENLSAILFPIKSPVLSAVFWIAPFEAILSTYVADCFAWSRSFRLYLIFKFLFVFLPIFPPLFLAKGKNP